LIFSLEAGHIRGAGLDVFSQEPLQSDSPFWARPDVVVTPHVSAVTRGFWARECDLILENLEHFQMGHPVLKWDNVVDKRAGY
jgi:phosphoglycerate dehydrogenase-like enzyme